MCTRRYVLGGVFDLEVIEERPGYLSFRASGKGVKKFFDKESGGHRFQRIPPSEKKGRVHTSTVTVVVMPEPTAIEITIHERDLVWQYFRGSGKGGQKRNKTSSAVRLTHEPSGIKIRVESERSQPLNKEEALTLLRSKLHSMKAKSVYDKTYDSRKNQAGSGMRADKIRTVQYQNKQVTDHSSGWCITLKKYLRGSW